MYKSRESQNLYVWMCGQDWFVVVYKPSCTATLNIKYGMQWLALYCELAIDVCNGLHYIVNWP